MENNSEILTCFEREYAIGDKDFSYKVKVTGSMISYIFGEGEKRVTQVIGAIFQNELYVLKDRFEVLTIKIK